MTPTYSATGRRRRILVPAPAESVRQTPPPAQDPPIYRALIRTWADRGRTLPGRHDPEWVRLAAPSAMYGYAQFSASLDARDEELFSASRDARDEELFSASRDPRGDGQVGASLEPQGDGQVSASPAPRGDGR
ncbi:hypothetical protein [Streptomyces sp. NBC_00500]|uniref:hypothetical protein n=1 Tax=unclassified Streptomyces TaxID=2593676 RepID=UPI003868CDC4